MAAMMTDPEAREAEHKAKPLIKAAEILEMRCEDERRYRDHPGRDDCYTDIARSRERESACVAGAGALRELVRSILGLG
jgi:hypothetical protein